MLGIRSYVEMGMSGILIALVLFFAIQSHLRGHRADVLQEKLDACEIKVAMQNASINALSKAAQEANKKAKEASEIAKKQAKDNYSKSKEIDKKQGKTCEDAEKLFRESVK